jgi:hypothetical protein
MQSETLNILLKSALSRVHPSVYTVYPLEHVSTAVARMLIFHIPYFIIWTQLFQRKCDSLADLT